MFKKIAKTFGFFSVTMLLLFCGLFIFISCKSAKFYKTPTFRTNQKKYIQPDTTEVFILGTVHNPTKKFNIDTLYNTLELIKPDIFVKSGVSTRLQ